MFSHTVYSGCTNLHSHQPCTVYPFFLHSCQHLKSLVFLMIVFQQVWGMVLVKIKSHFNKLIFMTNFLSRCLHFLLYSPSLTLEIGIWFLLMVISCFSLFFLVFRMVFYLGKVIYPLTDENYLKCIKRLAYFLISLKYLFYPLLFSDMCYLHIRYFYFSGIFPLPFILNSHLVILNLASMADFLKLLRKAGKMEMRSGTGVLRSPATQRDIK